MHANNPISGRDVIVVYDVILTITSSFAKVLSINDEKITIVRMTKKKKKKQIERS